MVKHPPAVQETWIGKIDPWIGKIPWRRERQPTPVFLPAEFHGQRSLVGYCPWGHKESDTTKRLTLRTLERYDGCSVLPNWERKLRRCVDSDRRGNKMARPNPGL